MKFFSWTIRMFLASAVISYLACTEKEEIAVLPPQPGIQFTNILVGSGIDSLPLEATAVPWYTPTNLAPKWETRWTCVKAPDGAPLPIIHHSNTLSARATGFMLGRYAFQVVFSTRDGEQKKTMQIEVIKDIDTGTQFVFDNLEWYLEGDMTPGSGNGSTIVSTSLYQRPDLFFFRGQNRYPKVEYQDPQNGQWIPVAKSTGNNGCAFGCIEEGAIFDIVHHNLHIVLIKGITPDWLRNAKSNPAVRLTY